MKLSEQIELIIKILDQCKSDDEWYRSQFKSAEAEETNLNHALIGIRAGQPRIPPLNAKERNKIVTQLQKELLKREVAKDYMRVSQQFIDYLNTENARNFQKKLSEILGKTRKAEQDMENRIYSERSCVVPENPNLQQNLNSMIKSYKKSRTSGERKKNYK